MTRDGKRTMMRFCFLILSFVLAAIVLQVAVFPAYIPPMLRPDFGILFGMIVLAFAPREFGLILLFAMGLQADLFGSQRFGLLTLSYLLAAGLILWFAWREFSRGDLISAWLGAVAGTALAHVSYILIGRICGAVPAGSPWPEFISLLVAAGVWGLPAAWIIKRCMKHLGTVQPSVREAWLAADRSGSARRGKASRR